jgi:hypothetical protein
MHAHAQALRTCHLSEALLLVRVERHMLLIWPVWEQLSCTGETTEALRPNAWLSQQAHLHNLAAAPQGVWFVWGTDRQWDMHSLQPLLPLLNGVAP